MPGQSSKMVQKCHTILGLAAATDDPSGIGANRDAKTCKFPISSVTSAYQHTDFLQALPRVFTRD